MAASYSIDQQRALVTITLDGAVTFDECVTLYSQLADDPAFRPGLKILCDLSAVTDLLLDARTVRRLSDDSTLNSASRHALVVTPGLVFGLARMYEMMARPGIARGVFLDSQEAQAWLDRAEPSPTAG
jgi:hypothetical protein